MRTFKFAFLLPTALVALACSQSPEAASTSPSLGATLNADAGGALAAGSTALAATMRFGQTDVGSPFPPSADHDQSAHANPDQRPSGSEVTRIGAMLEAGLENGAERRMFLSLALRLHVIPTRGVDHGNLTLRPRWTHASLLAGIGFRL